MQSVDFFDPQWRNEATTDPLFYVYDPVNDEMARISVEAEMAQRAVNVNNPSTKAILFIPVDHNMNIRKEGSNNLDSTCDYLMTVNNKELIISGEIKNRMRKWAREGMLQVLNTLEIFMANHNITEWKKCRGYVSNFRKPLANTSTKTTQEEFKQRSGGYRIYFQNTVNIDG